jgi:hypothetical protein
MTRATAARERWATPVGFAIGIIIAMVGLGCIFYALSKSPIYRPDVWDCAAAPTCCAVSCIQRDGSGG